MLQELQVIL